MKRVTTVEIIRDFGVHGDAALVEPIIVTKSGRDRLVLMSIEKYGTLRRAYDAIRGSHGHVTATQQPERGRKAWRP